MSVPRASLRAIRLVAQAPIVRRGYAAAADARISELVQDNKLFVFMKGTPDAPRCGFSQAVVQVLEVHGVDPDQLASFDVLSDEEIREGVKEFSDWPTIPQVYVDGEFVGGCDLMISMHQSGELPDLLAGIGIKSPLKED